ncbi:unnamed protein product [Linum trigynum]|uniref:Bifunctional inhibitor/plant lipid transfer protein/seed storage helical domain-containing protein n=1 Tax=Linum trigynum TaxID=586398 RepID=A0AAV2EKA1_9ROSI
MDSSRLRRLLLLFAAAALLAGTAESDLEQEKTECAPKLVGLAPCLPYVGGESKAPTLDCCSGLKQVLDKSRKCLCLLIKDRDEDLGVKINISLAANLPGSCKSPVNVSDCVSLLHLKPNSTEAKKFDGLDEIIGKGANSSSTATAAAPSAAASAASGGRATVIGGGGNANQKSNHGGDQARKRKNREWVAVTAVGVLWGLITGFPFFF